MTLCRTSISSISSYVWGVAMRSNLKDVLDRGGGSPESSVRVRTPIVYEKKIHDTYTKSGQTTMDDEQPQASEEATAAAARRCFGGVAAPVPLEAPADDAPPPPPGEVLSLIHI